MGGELVKTPPMHEVFEELFPSYLVMGMTHDQYWHGDPELVKFYREAERLSRKKSNYDAWLQGLYVYEAIASLAPVLQAFAKKGTKARPYSKEPYDVVEKSEREQEAERKRKAEEAERERQKAIAYFSALEQRWNK